MVALVVFKVGQTRLDKGKVEGSLGNLRNTGHCFNFKSATMTNVCNGDKVRGFNRCTSRCIDLFLFRESGQHLKTHEG